MNTIICGSRSFGYRIDLVWDVLATVDWPITAVLTGAPNESQRRTIDDAGRVWAARHAIPYTAFPADWAQYGRAAGPRRNAEMAKHAGACVAIWDGTSRGTANMISIARAQGLRVKVVRYVQTSANRPAHSETTPGRRA